MSTTSRRGGARISLGRKDFDVVLRLAASRGFDVLASERLSETEWTIVVRKRGGGPAETRSVTYDIKADRYVWHAPGKDRAA